MRFGLRLARGMRGAGWAAAFAVWAGLGLGMAGQSSEAAAAKRHTAASSGHKAASSGRKGSSSGHKGASSGRRGASGVRESSRTSGRRRRPAPAETAESRRLRAAFVASAELRPMAQQLAAYRTAAAYAGVEAYARSHTGEPAAAAELALGHAYLLDRRYAEAETSLRAAVLRSSVLSDYAEYLGAQAAVKAGRPQDAVGVLEGFAGRHPGSLFVSEAPVLEAQAETAMGQPGAALRVLEPLRSSEAGGHVAFRLALAQAEQAAGQREGAAELARGLYLKDPLSPEAATAKQMLDAMSLPLTPGERKEHADALFNAHQYAQARGEYAALEKSGAGLSQGDRDALEVYAAVCDLRLKHLSRSDAERLPVTSDDSAALKLYLQAELARSSGEDAKVDEQVEELEAKYGQSRWTEEALHSAGNMYLLERRPERAIAEYEALTERFPRSVYAPQSQWHAAWLSYRLRRSADAARLMEEQIERYPGDENVPGALYWRGRLYEDEEHNFGQAGNFYRRLNEAYPGSYYAMLARERLKVIGSRGGTVAAASALAAVRAVDDPGLSDALPENDVHLIKARLLANAALTEYIRPEIQMSPGSEEWGALAEAQIYVSFGEDWRALQAMKRSRIPFFSLRVDEVPMAYWELVFPRPYWSNLKADAEANGVDPYLVTSLIRQESEFNPGAVSPANAYGLMQLLPSVGKQLARRQGDRHFTTAELLNPVTNLELGTRDLRQSLDRYNGQVEYALAAYNAGDLPVRQWIAQGSYKDVAEWVESIPYTETREYVQGILRNREMYHAVYAGR